MSVGDQIGGEAGSFVLVLNNDKAVNSFATRNNWSLDANAGLTIVNWSKEGHASAGKGDITLWSDATGLFGGAAVRISDVKSDRDQTSAYYGRQVAVDDVLNGTVTKPEDASLKQALASGGSARNASNPPTSASSSSPR